jgi:hypothetical protein
MARGYVTHPSTCLRYRTSADTPVHGRARYELVDYPGHIDTVFPIRADSHTAICDECCEERRFQFFTQAMEYLRDHVERHKLERRTGQTIRPLGFKMANHPKRRTLWIAQCETCSWWSGARVNRGDAYMLGIHHVEQHQTPNPGKQEPMRTQAQIERDLEILAVRYDQLQAELAERAKLPAEPDVDVISFEVQFDQHGPTYKYTARHTQSAWFLTGRETSGKSWDQVLEFMGRDVRVRAGRRRLQFEELEVVRTVKAAK